MKKIVKNYLRELEITGIPVNYGILFGSYTGNRTVTKWSDIDLLVVSPIYDKLYTRNEINLLWRIAARIDSRIEPIAVGTQQFEIDDKSTILEVARREGEKIYPQDIEDSVL
ncbi:MAG: nucleotidyltransferase domain-containing protein [Desulfamplus sp.]|nr:nucleotidyltransferase domain-containing protein [Desulfamplus sp.]